MIHLLVQRFESFAGAEEERNTPDTCQSNNGVDNPAAKRSLTAQQPRHKVESEQSDASPVQGADDGDDQSDSVHNHCQILLWDGFPLMDSLNAMRKFMTAK